MTQRLRRRARPSGTRPRRESAAKAQTDFVGIAVHCAQRVERPVREQPEREARPAARRAGRLHGLQGALRREVRRPGDHRRQPVRERHRRAADHRPAGNCGFPGFDGMLAKNTLGYVAQMQENGVPVTYGYISDAHDIHTPTRHGRVPSTAHGPGEAGYKAAAEGLRRRVRARSSRAWPRTGSTSRNTLFVVTVDEGDHFAGGIGTPQPDGTLAYTHTNCADADRLPGEPDRRGQREPAAGCSGRQRRRSRALRRRADLLRQRQPGPDRPAVRKLEHELGGAEAEPTRTSTTGSGAARRSTRRPGRGADAAHGQRRPGSGRRRSRCSATPTSSSQPRLERRRAERQPVRQPGLRLEPRRHPGRDRQHVGRLRRARASRSHGVDSTTWTDHTNLRPTILALTRAEGRLRRRTAASSRRR